MIERHSHHRPRQRGAAALVIVLLLALVATLGGAYASRQAWVDLRSAREADQALQAQQAAEAGLDWAIAMQALGRIDAQCQASADAAAPGFLARHLTAEADGRLRVSAAQATLRPGCSQRGGAWACTCAGEHAWPAPGDPASAFRLQFIEAPDTGVVRVLAEGRQGDARARASVLLGRVPALAAVPPAALTVHGRFDANDLAAGLTNTDATANGLALVAGQGVTGDAALRIASVPGSPPEAAVLRQDPRLGAMDAAQFQAAGYAVDEITWRRQPAVHRVACADGGCSSALAAAAQAHPGQPLWVAGDLVLDAPLTLGSAAQPVLLRVDGRVDTQAAATLTGLLHLRGHELGGPALLQVRGAVVAEGDLRLTGTPQITHDAAALAPLREAQGSLVRVPGSWRDFDPQ